jgi:hypothetical protein
MVYADCLDCICMKCVMNMVHNLANCPNCLMCNEDLNRKKRVDECNEFRKQPHQ